MHEGDPLAPGSLLADRYRVGPLLGTGGMSFVHRGTDTALGRDVAIKALLRGSTDPAALQRAQSEIDLLATLSHRALVTLFDAGSAGVGDTAVTYLVMELIDGPTLGARAATDAIAPADLAAMARDLAEALVVVHAAGVVHRDIKPANVLLAPSPVPGREFDAKLADFGIASIVDGTRLTATGTVLGTAAYLSPEQATGARVGPASDIYSLGLVLLEAITGRREYPGPLMESLTARQSRDPVVPGAIGYRWKSLLTAMTARDPEERPSAAELLEQLEDAAGAAALPLAAGRDHASVTAVATPSGRLPRTAETAPLPAAAGATAGVDPGDGDEDRRSRRRAWVIVGSVAAALALLAMVTVLGLQGLVAPESSNAPVVAETPAATVEAPAPTAEPTEVADEPVATTPVEPAPVPAVDESTTDGGEQEAPAPADGSGTEGNGNGNQGNGNGGNGNGGNGSGGNGSGGNGSGGNNGNGNAGNGNGGNGNGGNGNPGNGNSGNGNG